MAEYCDTLQSKEKRNWEHKACLNDRALRLLDQGFIEKYRHFVANEKHISELFWKTLAGFIPEYFLLSSL
jgi:hypothetical protein